MRKRISRKFAHAIQSKASKKGGNRACLCPDLTYHVDCCDGTLHAQGVGKTQATT